MVVAVIGAGRMGGAMARGWIRAGIVPPDALRLYRRDAARLAEIAAEMGAVAANSVENAVRGADVIVFGVKPFALAEVLRNAAPFLAPHSLVVSLAAGVRLNVIEAALPDAPPVLRVMPNTPAQIGHAASAFCRGTHATDSHAAMTLRLLQAVGVAYEVTEAQLDAVIGVAGSGVAYFYLLIEALTDGGVRAGLPRDMARTLAAQTASGAAQMILQSGEHPAALKDAVTTPGGTTIAALAVLEKSGVRGVIMDAVEAAARRAQELA